MVATTHTAFDAGVGGVGAAGVAVAVHGPERGDGGAAGGAGGGDGGDGGDRAATGCRAVLAALRLRRPPGLGAHDRRLVRRRRPWHRSRRLPSFLRQDRPRPQDQPRQDRRAVREVSGGKFIVSETLISEFYMFLLCLLGC